MAIDSAALRSLFPALGSGVAYFDGPGGTQTPRPVAEAIAETMMRPLSIRGTSTESERNAERIVGDFRVKRPELSGHRPQVEFGADWRGIPCRVQRRAIPRNIGKKL